MHAHTQHLGGQHRSMLSGLPPTEEAPLPSHKVSLSHLHSHNTYNPETKSQPVLCMSRKLAVFLSHAHWPGWVEAPLKHPLAAQGTTHTLGSRIPRTCLPAIKAVAG